MGYFDEELKGRVDRPKVSKQQERHIGAFFIAWNTLEAELNVAFPVMFRVDATLAGCIYSNLMTSTKLDILSSGVDSLSIALGERLSASAHKILVRIKDLTEARNTLAHGQIGEAINEETKKIEWRLMRLVARKEQSIIFHKSSARDLRRLTNGVLAVTDAWHQKCRAIHERLKKFSDEDIEGLAQLHMKDAKPIALRRRKRQPPKRGGSRGHRTKPGKA